MGALLFQQTLPVSDFDLGGWVGIIAWVVEQSSLDNNPLRWALLRKACQHVIVGVVVDESRGIIG